MMRINTDHPSTSSRIKAAGLWEAPRPVLNRLPLGHCMSHQLLPHSTQWALLMDLSFSLSFSLRTWRSPALECHRVVSEKCRHITVSIRILTLSIHPSALFFSPVVALFPPYTSSLSSSSEHINRRTFIQKIFSKNTSVSNVQNS